VRELAVVLSGMAALVYEIAWIRPLQYLLGSTTYTLAIIYSAFMLGLGIGSIVGARIKSERKNLALVEFGIAIYAPLSLFFINSLPSLYRKIASLYSNFFLFSFLAYFLIFLFLLLPTTLMGITWPLFVGIVKKGKPSEDIGRIYALNNLGAAAGALFAVLVFIPFLGIKYTLIAAAALNFLAGILVSDIKEAVPALAFFLLLTPFANYQTLNLYKNGFYRALILPEDVPYNMSLLFHAEGAYATIDVLEEGGGVMSLLINGKGQGGTSPTDLRVNYLLAYLPILLNNPQKVLVIGLGTGTTAGHLARHAHVTVVEIEPKVVEATSLFRDANLDLLNNENVTLVIDDGRNFLLKTSERYDVIIPEPSDPWQDFSSPLFSKEFFELGRKHLKENGLFIQWVPIYQLRSRDFRSFYHTFHEVFPHVVAFANVNQEERAGPYPTELILVGSPSPIEVDRIYDRFYLLDERSREELSRVIFMQGVRPRAEGETAADRILSLVVFTSEELGNYGDEAPLITDDNLLLEYSAPRNLFRIDRMEVIEDIEKWREGLG